MNQLAKIKLVTSAAKLTNFIRGKQEKGESPSAEELENITNAIDDYHAFGFSWVNFHVI